MEDNYTLLPNLITSGNKQNLGWSISFDEPKDRGNFPLSPDVNKNQDVEPIEMKGDSSILK